MSFEERIRRAAQYLVQLPEPILIVGHLDTDGLAATAIIQDLLTTINKKYSTQILPQISSAFLQQLPESKSLVVLDGGSTYSFDRPSLVIDHHQETCEHKNVFLLNPLLDNLDGTRDACAATIAWVIANELKRPDKASLAVLGAVGDNQDKPGLTSYNAQAAKTAQEYGLQIIRAPKLFGIYSHTIKQLLINSFDLRIPGVTKNPHGVQELLDALKIDPYKKYSELTKEKQQELLSVLEQKKSASLPLYEHYSLPFDGVLQDAKRCATFINACGRLQKPELALSILLGGDSSSAPKVLQEYKETLNKAMRVYEEEKDVRKNIVVFNAKDAIMPAIAGTVCSIVTKSKMVREDVIVLALARYEQGLTKVSARTMNKKEDLLLLITKAAQAAGGEFGGHRVAAGAIIPSDKENEFIDAFCSFVE